MTSAAQMMLGVEHLTLVDTDLARAEALVELIARHFGSNRLSVARDVEDGSSRTLRRLQSRGAEMIFDWFTKLLTGEA